MFPESWFWKPSRIQTSKWYQTFLKKIEFSGAVKQQFAEDKLYDVCVENAAFVGEFQKLLAGRF